MTASRPSTEDPRPSLKPGELGQQGLMRRGECKVWGCVYNIPTTSKPQGNIPEVLLWPTNTIDPEDRCVFHRTSEQMHGIMTRKAYKEASPSEKETKLGDAGNAYYETWSDVLFKYLQDGFEPPRLQPFVEQWIEKHALDLVAAGPDEDIALPAPPTQGWNHLLTLEPETSDDAVTESQAVGQPSTNSATPAGTSYTTSGSTKVIPSVSSSASVPLAGAPSASETSADGTDRVQRRGSRGIKRMRFVIDSSEDEGETIESTSSPRRHDEAALEAAQPQEWSVGAPATSAERLTELKLRFEILEERRKHFRNIVFGYELGSAEMSERATAQQEETEKQREESRVATQWTVLIKRWQSELEEHIMSLALEQANPGKLADPLTSSRGDADRPSQPHAHTSHPSLGKGKAREDNTGKLDEADGDAASSPADC